MFSASFGPPTFRCERLFLLLRISGSSAENFISLFVSLCDCLSMELFIRRRWRLINKLLYFLNCAYVCGRHFINATACPLSQYKPSSPSTTELHGMYVSHSIDLLVSLSVSFSLCLSYSSSEQKIQNYFSSIISFCKNKWSLSKKRESIARAESNL